MVDIMGDNRAYTGGSGGVSGGGTWDQTDGDTFDGNADSSLILLPGTVNLGTTDPGDVTFDIYGPLADSLFSSYRQPLATARGTLVSDGWDVSITPSVYGSFDGAGFELQAKVGGIAVGSRAFYTINPAPFGIGPVFTADVSFDPVGVDTYAWRYGNGSSGPVTIIIRAVGNVGPVVFSATSDSTTGITYDDHGGLPVGGYYEVQIDVDQSSLDANGDLFITATDFGPSPPEVAPRVGHQLTITRVP